MKCHVKFIAVTKIRPQISWPLICLRQKHSSREMFIELPPQLLQDRMSLREILAISTFAFHQVWNGVEPERVHAHFEPVLHYIPHLFPNRRIVVVEIGLVAKKTMPIK